MGRNRRTYSAHTLKAISLFATQIKIARKKQRWSEMELAERAGTSRSTIRQIEKGSPTTELGLYFEIASLLGIALFDADDNRLNTLHDNLSLQLALLPKRISSESSEVFDDF
ncbi:helix-turn-helix domain-containing protein [uncultured Amphritea sp.]|uniref:helix-turn-helix transcriptional regulator n=1 Tax=uncultured Amphritea sp. TaxID=981605 RepID=UPI002632CB33|nr:helix-turn-helix domain-containing protein [uncultured Amphritea sp.]